MGIIKRELSNKTEKFKNIVKNANYTNTTKVSEGYNIFFPPFVYVIRNSKLNNFQKQYLKLLIKESETAKAA